MMTRKPNKRQENRTKLPDMPTTVGSLPKLFPDERIVDSANRTFITIEEILNSNHHYQALRLNPTNIYEIKAKLFLIVNTYWADLHKFEGPGVAERRIALKKVEKLACKLKETLSETPSAFRIDLNKYLKARSKIDETPTDLKIIREHLEGLIFALGVLNKEPDPERRPRKRHVADLVKAAAALWVELTGEKFNINLERGEDRDPTTGDLANDIVAPSPRFVRSVALAIDSELTESEVLSAISTMNSNKQK